MNRFRNEPEFQHHPRASVLECVRQAKRDTPFAWSRASISKTHADAGLTSALHSMNRLLKLLAVLFLTAAPLYAGDAPAPSELDLATVLRLAGARNLDVKLAEEKLSEAEARYDSATWQFFPWLGVGVGYRRHDNRIQTVEGDIIDADKQSLNAGGTLTAQVDLGDAIYRRLVEKQKREAARLGVQSANARALRDAVAAYFDLAKAEAVSDAIAESLRVSEAYEKQLTNAVGIGVAYKGDELRVRVQSERYRMAQRQAQEKRAIAAAKLAEVLRLDAATPLRSRQRQLVPLSVVSLKTPVGDFIAEAQAARPEVSEMAAFVAAAEQERKAARYAPLVPALTAQGFFGTLGGGRESDMDRFGSSSDVVLGLSWRIGPGGLFDSTRERQAAARQNIAQLEQVKLADRLATEVAVLHARAKSLNDQVAMARDNLKTATESLAAGEQRKEAGVGVVLEVVQSQQDLTQSRLAYVETVAEQNKAQYELLHALGRLGKSAPSK
jgi:outer membrane protein TolC